MTSARAPQKSTTAKIAAAQSADEQDGLLFILSAPSGAGKTSISRRLQKEDGMALSVSHTTRAPRPGEIHGRDYFFADEDEFQKMADTGKFLESAVVHGGRYGTDARWVREQTQSGRDVLLEIDWQGASQVRRRIDGAVSVFVMPPSPDALQERLIRRGQDSAATIAKRMKNAEEEIRHAGEFDYVIINDDLNSAVADFRAIVRAARIAAKNNAKKHNGKNNR